MSLLSTRFASGLPFAPPFAPLETSPLGSPNLHSNVEDIPPEPASHVRNRPACKHNSFGVLRFAPGLTPVQQSGCAKWSVPVGGNGVWRRASGRRLLLTAMA